MNLTHQQLLNSLTLIRTTLSNRGFAFQEAGEVAGVILNRIIDQPTLLPSPTFRSHLIIRGYSLDQVEVAEEVYSLIALGAAILQESQS